MSATTTDHRCVIKGHITDDDGRTFPVVDQTDCQGAYCPDCGGGQLVWAEAGFVPWHRVCSRCGSHWDASDNELTGKTVAELNARPNERLYRVRRARFF